MLSNAYSYPEDRLQSILVKNLCPDILFMTSSIFGIGSASNSVTLLSFPKSMQNRT